MNQNGVLIEYNKAVITYLNIHKPPEEPKPLGQTSPLYGPLPTCNLRVTSRLGTNVPTGQTALQLCRSLYNQSAYKTHSLIRGRQKSKETVTHSSSPNESECVKTRKPYLRKVLKKPLRAHFHWGTTQQNQEKLRVLVEATRY